MNHDAVSLLSLAGGAAVAAVSYALRLRRDARTGESVLLRGDARAGSIFQVSSINGFLPNTDPLVELPAQFKELEKVCGCLRSYLRGLVRDTSGPSTPLWCALASG